MKKVCTAYRPAKKIYDSQKQAQHQLGVSFSYGRANLGELHTYKCPACGGWHLGHVKYAPK